MITHLAHDSIFFCILPDQCMPPNESFSSSVVFPPSVSPSLQTPPALPPALLSYSLFRIFVFECVYFSCSLSLIFTTTPTRPLQSPFILAAVPLPSPPSRTASLSLSRSR